MTWHLYNGSNADIETSKHMQLTGFSTYKGVTWAPCGVVRSDAGGAAAGGLPHSVAAGRAGPPPVAARARQPAARARRLAGLPVFPSHRGVPMIFISLVSFTRVSSSLSIC
jgi:hypothetical protein